MFKKLIIAGMIILFLMYVIPLLCIIYNQNSKIDKEVDYLIVLGAKVNQYGPTKTLEYRLDKAVDYYNKYPNVKIVVTGGKGFDEPRPEGEVMKDYLIEKGVSKDNILVEDKSTSTFENMEFSKKIIENETSDYTLGIVTTNFHIFRSEMIAKRVFNKNDVLFQSSKNYDGATGVYSLLREPLALYKSFILDRK